MTATTGGVFRSLRTHDYRVWASGAIVSNVGTWMQRTAQDWIVLTRLTNHDAVAVGVTMALQFGPQLLMLPISGLVADRVPKRRVLMCTQAAMGVLALGLGLLTVTGAVTLAEVFVFAFLLGCAAAFDAPARQSFVSELVDGGDVSNAVALNAASFNSARLIGPAIAGLLTEVVGAGWVFLLNAVSFAAVLISLHSIAPTEPGLARPARGRSPGDMAAGFRYVWSRPDLVVRFVMVFLLGTFGLNFPIYASTMAVLFHQGATGFGLLSAALAAGAVAGALLAARRTAPRFSLLILAGTLFGVGLIAAAFAPNYVVLAVLLPLVGIAAQTFTTAANSGVQLSVEHAIRGRVMALYLAIFLGGTVVGAPIIGWITNLAGPRAGLVVGGAAGLGAAAIGGVWQHRHPEPAPTEATGAAVD